MKALKFVPNSTAMRRFLAKVDKGDTCWHWRGATLPAGYGTFLLNGESNCKIGAHVASFILHGKNFVHGLDVAHVCDNPSCVNPDHLVQLSHGDNMRDSIQKQRHPTIGKSGEGNINVKLTTSQVGRIREDTRKHKDIAKDYGVSRSTIGYVKRGDTWRS